MRVLLCGEGAHDVGVSDVWNAALGAYETVDGWMQPVVREACERGAVEFTVSMRRDLPILGRETRGLRPMPAGHGAKALIAKRQALQGGHDAVIFMVDADSNRPSDWSAKVAEIEEGFSRIAGDIICIACVPMSASESWLMADAAAWRAVVGYDGVDLPRRPETCWGARTDPAGNHPHRLFARICARAGLHDDRDTRVRLAIGMDLATCRHACPVSLDPFLRALAAA